jgi:hypothetical protein
MKAVRNCECVQSRYFVLVNAIEVLSLEFPQLCALSAGVGDL